MRPFNDFRAARAAPSLLAGLCVFAFAITSHAAQSVQALRYGTTLYHYYQQNYFDALTELMVAQQTGELGAHGQNAELLRGGMSLSYGMDLQAEQIFTALLSQPQAGADRNRAWFYLAKIAWQRDQFERTAAALQQITESDTAEFNDEFNYLRASLSIKQGDYQSAQETISRLPADSSWLPYHYYNMGARRAAAGDWAGGGHWSGSGWDSRE